uniref:Putative secreted protein n=1 Tax=Anopheles darlingi TaxID=43151 RepID=A0A2M4DIL1_ANODA
MVVEMMLLLLLMLPVCSSLPFLPRRVLPVGRLKQLIEMLRQRGSKRQQFSHGTILKGFQLYHREALQDVVHAGCFCLQLRCGRRKTLPELFQQLEQRKIEIAYLFLDIWWN